MTVSRERLIVAANANTFVVKICPSRADVKTGAGVFVKIYSFDKKKTV